MEKIKILISFGLADQYVQKIKEMGLALEIRQSRDNKELVKLISDVEVLFAGRLNKEMFLAAKELKWIHYFGAGVDHILFPELVESPVILTNSKGIYATPVSEHVFGLILSLTKRLHLLVRDQLERKWKRVPVEELEGKTLGIVGLGSVGYEVARKAKCFGMSVIATKRNVSAKPEYVDELLPPANLQELLARSDFVVLTVPLTAETRGLIGENQLRNMKRTAYLVNVSRGKVVQEDALVKALKEGWIAGAALDVFEEEPLLRGSKLWKMKNVIITPHTAGWSVKYWERTTSLFCENLKRFVYNEPMINVVNKQLGY